MNPSYDNGFGSFGSGGANPSSGVNGDAGSVGSGQTNMVFGSGVGAGGAASGGAVGATAAGGAISSGTGDVILASAPEKKSKKGLVIGLAVMVVLVLVGVGIGFLMSNGSGGKVSVASQIDEVRKDYDNYINYVLLGEESDKKMSMDVVIDGRPYFLSLVVGKKEEYAKKADEKLETLANSYNKYNEMLVEQEGETEDKDSKEGAEDDEGGDETDETRDGSGVYVGSLGDMRLDVLRSYFKIYATIEPLSNADILEVYKSDGGEEALAMIARRYDIGSSELFLSSYLDAAREYANMYLNVLMKATASGCVVDNESSLESCAAITDEDKAGIAAKIYEMVEAEMGLASQARNVLIEFYNWLYESNGVEVGIKWS